MSGLILHPCGAGLVVGGHAARPHAQTLGRRLLVKGAATTSAAQAWRPSSCAHHRRGDHDDGTGGRARSSLFNGLLASAAALCVLLSLAPVTEPAEAWGLVASVAAAAEPSDTFDNVPQTLSGSDRARRIQRPKSGQAESCTRKCVSTCIRGGAGAPGEGPLNVRRPLVVFKEGFRSRQYCLLECSEICNLIPDGQDGP